MPESTKQSREIANSPLAFMDPNSEENKALRHNITVVEIKRMLSDIGRKVAQLIARRENLSKQLNNLRKSRKQGNDPLPPQQPMTVESNSLDTEAHLQQLIADLQQDINQLVRDYQALQEAYEQFLKDYAPEIAAIEAFEAEVDKIYAASDLAIKDIVAAHAPDLIPALTASDPVHVIMPGPAHRAAPLLPRPVPVRRILEKPEEFSVEEHATGRLRGTLTQLGFDHTSLSDKAVRNQNQFYEALFQSHRSTSIRMQKLAQSTLNDQPEIPASIDGLGELLSKLYEVERQLNAKQNQLASAGRNPGVDAVQRSSANLSR